MAGGHDFPMQVHTCRHTATVYVSSQVCMCPRYPIPLSVEASGSVCVVFVRQQLFNAYDIYICMYIRVCVCMYVYSRGCWVEEGWEWEEGWVEVWEWEEEGCLEEGCLA